MTRVPPVALALLVTACTTAAAPWPLHDPRDISPEPWPAYTLCTLDAPEALADVLRAALDVWRVEGWEVRSEALPNWMARNLGQASYDCVPVLVVPVEAAFDWPDGRVAQTLMAPETYQPVAIEIREDWWAACPWARWLTLLHEIGHAVGHVEHTVARGVMGREVACTPDAELEPLPDPRSIDWARRRRAGLQ